MKVSFSVISMATLLCALLTPAVSADDNTEAFNKLDVDGDGFVTSQEALAHDKLPDAFDDGDENGDGLLDLIEFIKLEITDE